MKMKSFDAMLIAALFSALAPCAAEETPPPVYGDIPDYGEKYLSPDFVKLGKSELAVTCRTGDELLLLDPQSKGVKARVPLGGHPSGLAFSPDEKFAYVTIAAPRESCSKSRSLTPR